jgi:uncharacterized protein
MGRLKKFAHCAVLAAGLSLAAPAVAQQFSEAHQFLKAVKDRDGNAATEALQRPGSTVVNARDLTTGQSALHYVVQRRDTVWLRFLLGKGANPNLADTKEVTPLQLAANLGWTDGVEILVARGAQVDVANSAGETPLIAAVHNRNTALVRVLLAAGADPDRTDNSGRSARDYASLAGGANPVLAALDEAAKARRERTTKTYGPGA